MNISDYASLMSMFKEDGLDKAAASMSKAKAKSMKRQDKLAYRKELIKLRKEALNDYAKLCPALKAKYATFDEYWKVLCGD